MSDGREHAVYARPDVRAVPCVRGHDIRARHELTGLEDGQQRPKERFVPVPGVRRSAALLARLLRPGGAVINAGDAAARASDARAHRRRVEQEVESLADDGQPSEDR